MIWIAVAAGGAVGAVARFAVVGAAARLLGPGFPFGTLTVNALGSLLMGVLAALFLARMPDSAHLRAFLMTGLLGGFTTFSAFSLDAFTLFEEDRLGAALGYVAASVILSLLALTVGIALARSLA